MIFSFPTKVNNIDWSVKIVNLNLLVFIIFCSKFVDIVLFVKAN